MQYSILGSNLSIRAILDSELLIGAILIEPDWLTTQLPLTALLYDSLYSVMMPFLEDVGISFHSIMACVALMRWTEEISGAAVGVVTALHYRF